MYIKYHISENDIKNKKELYIFKYLREKKYRFDLIQKLFRKKLITVNNRKLTKSDKYFLLKENDIIVIRSNIIPYSNDKYKKNKHISQKLIDNLLSIIKQSIIFEDENIIIINKKENIPVQSGSNIKISIADILPFLSLSKDDDGNNINQLKLVHRLDKNTSGLLIIGKNNIMANKLLNLFKERKIQKYYLAYIEGKMKYNSGVINMKIGKKFNKFNEEKIYKDDINGKESITRYRIINYNSKYNYSTILLNPKTGRTHQLRVHMKELGHKIIGDYKYGYKKRDIDLQEDRLYLHSYKLIFLNYLFKKLPNNY